MIPITPSDFRFTTDEESRAYLREIVETMMRSFGITRDEAVGRINEEWSHVSAVVGEDDIYRDFPKRWANHFMYGKRSFWWVSAARREQLGLPPLTSLPFPRRDEP